MEKRNVNRSLAAALLVVVAVLGYGLIGKAGNLEPPAGPAPTMKTLDEVEPRTPVNDLMVPGDGDYHHIISQPGSYILTGNLDVTKPNGIDIRAEGVTLDLMGFEIRRTAGVDGNGVEIDDTSHRCTVKNGSLAGFAYGVRCLDRGGLFVRSGSFLHLSATDCSTAGLESGDGWLIDGCQAHDNPGKGIVAHTGCTLTKCTATENQGTHAISTGSGCTLNKCTASNNSVDFAIYAGSGSTLTDCTALANTGSGSYSYAISANAGSTLTNCTARDNSSSGTWSGGIRGLDGCILIGCTATGTTTTRGTPNSGTGVGIIATNFCLVKNCQVYYNAADGIQCSNDNFIVGNKCASNGRSITNGAGISVGGVGDNHVEGNNVIQNDIGINATSAGNIIMRNTAAGNSINYEIVASNKVGVIVYATSSAAISGLTGGAGLGTTDPWANFSY